MARMVTVRELRSRIGSDQKLHKNVVVHVRLRDKAVRKLGYSWVPRLLDLNPRLTVNREGSAYAMFSQAHEVNKFPK